MKIDVFPHIFPKRFFARMLEVAGGNHYMQKRMRAIPVLVDLEQRFRIMDRYEGYVQVLTLASPPIEALAGPDVTPELARLAADEQPRRRLDGDRPRDRHARRHRRPDLLQRQRAAARRAAVPITLRSD